MSRLMERLIPAVIGLLLLGVAGYQLMGYFHQRLDTDTVYEYTVSRSITSQGIAVRNEVALDESSTGSEFYPLDDASRVAIGEVVAEPSRGRAGGQTLNRAKTLEDELRMLREAESTVADFANTEVYNRDIKQQLGKLSAMASEGRYSELTDLRQSLTMNINKKQISNGKAQNFSVRISLLQGELDRTAATAALDTGSAIKAPRAGYFSKGVDGYEARLTPDNLETLSVSDYTRLIESGAPALESKKVGKLVLNQNWTFAVTVPAHNLEWIGQGQSVQIQFDQIAQRVPAKVSEILEEKGNETAVLLLGCNHMNEELINLRASNVVLHFQEHTGLRINTANLRFRINEETGESERGVYILRNNMVYFRLVDPIYEESTFLLTKTYYTSEDYLEPQRQQRRLQQAEEPEEPPDLSLEEQEAAAQEQGENAKPAEPDYKRYVILFDQVITKGMDLYDEKPIQGY